MSPLERGKHYLDKKKYPQAIKALEKAASGKGDIYYYIDTYSLLGDAYAENGQEYQAISVYRNALQIIHIRLREISAQRREIRMSLVRESQDSHVNMPDMQEEDMGLADEEWQLNEHKGKIKRKVNKLLKASDTPQLHQ
jgi:tetratricopeptide (TPR) repeat protein